MSPPQFETPFRLALFLRYCLPIASAVSGADAGAGAGAGNDTGNSVVAAAAAASGDGTVGFDDRTRSRPTWWIWWT